MSNKSLKLRINSSLASFQDGNVSISKLRDSLELNGKAFENVNYDLIQELDDILHQLMTSQFAEEEECESGIAEVIQLIRHWLEKLPD
ncbi:hypothetical protein [Thalassotalea euphylliae]|uniref:Uncharacterized protein n=1 Tax=Thalassotalea euphylliae TaxID=1655234 RepID=A0A3E0UFD8_9GAMM|nr:hypothetical protein [Thalassotalea euphylliae]REL35384.1 hypothetical protein DXX92_08460 [Thalassotalea euphylliae]